MNRTERIQVWGAFTLAKPEDRNDYRHLSVATSTSRCRRANRSRFKQWADLKASPERTKSWPSAAATNSRFAFAAQTKSRPIPMHLIPATDGPLCTEADCAPVKSLLEFAHSSR